jgi:predicted nucleotidyltransferase
MQLLTSTAASELPLAAVLRRVAASDKVDGIALFGSQSAAMSPVSDYDILILINDPTIRIFQMLTHIDSRLADIVFVETELAERVLLTTEPFAQGTFEAMFLLKMGQASIVYDPAGRLHQVQAWVAHTEPSAWLRPSSDTDLYAAWFWQNQGLAHLKRMVQSDDPVYQTATDMLLCACLSGVTRAYYTVRSLAWEGEKRAVRHLQDSDPAFLAQLRACLTTMDRVEKLRHYEELVRLALAPVGAPWQTGVTAVYLRGPDQSSPQIEAALQFWNSLVAF